MKLKKYGYTLPLNSHLLSHHLQKADAICLKKRGTLKVVVLTGYQLMSTVIPIPIFLRNT